MGSEPPDALCHHNSRPCRGRSHRSEKSSQLPRNIFLISYTVHSGCFPCSQTLCTGLTRTTCRRYQTGTFEPAGIINATHSWLIDEY